MGLETDRRGPGRATTDIAPVPSLPERVGTVYERKYSPADPGMRGPLRWEEGIATDTAVPDDFMQGMGDGYQTPPGRPNHNTNVYEKFPAQTMQERAHLGSAAWTEAPEFLTAFAAGTSEPPVNYPQIARSGAHYNRVNPATVSD
jgi:hypothetical protein